MPGAEPVSIAFDVAPQANYLARVEQFEFDATLELMDAEGRVLWRGASPARALGHEYLFWIAEQPGRLTLRIRAAAVPGAAARYRARVFRLPATAPRIVAAALQQMTRAAATPAEGAIDAATRAGVLRAAEATWRALGQQQLAADTALQLAGLQYFDAEQWSDARAAAERAARDYTRLGASHLLADASLLEGAADLEIAHSAERSTPRFAAADAALARARALYQRAQAPTGAATALIYTGTGQYYRNELDAAVSSFSSAEAEFAATGAAAGRLFALSNLAVIRLDRGDYRGVAQTYEQLLALPHDDLQWRATSLQNGAIALSVIGEGERAIAWYLESLQIGDELHDRSLAAGAMTGLGLAHERLGQPDLAVGHLEQAVRILRSLKDNNRLAVVLGNLGDANSQAGRPLAAAALLREAISLLSPDASPMRRARLAVALAGELARAGESREAIRLYSEVLALPNVSLHTAISQALVGRARLYRITGQFALARRDLERAVALTRANDNREDLIAALNERALLARARGAADEALRDSATAVRAIDALRDDATNPDNRVTLTAKLRGIYDVRVELLADAALRAGTRGDAQRSQSLAFAALDAASRANLQLDSWRSATRDVDPRTDTRIERIYEALAGRRHRLDALSERSAPATPTMQSLEREIGVLRSQLAAMRPPAAPPDEMPDAEAVSATALQARLIGDSVLLAYTLGETRSWLWVVTRDRFELRPLPPQADVDARIATLLRDVTSLRSPARIAASVSAVRDALLPAEAGLLSQRRLLVIPDGSIGAVPWSLLGPGTVRLTAVQLPSLNALALSRTPARQSPPTSPLRLALFGDPIFNADDSRIAAGAPRPAPIDVPAASLERLPGTAAEVEAIARLSGGNAVQPNTGAAANRRGVLVLSAATTDVLHLATHAILDARTPELAAIVMSRFDARGTVETGEIRARQILGMAAPPPLVVLSACDTASTPSRSAAGLMNLSRAFLAAGSNTVVASLWPVSDAGAVAFMTEFYRGLLQQGLRPDAALASAQMALANSHQWSAPFFWAGFVIVSMDQ